MSVTSIQQAAENQLGTSVFPIPLDACRIQRPYLLERAGLSMTSTALFFAVPYLIAADAYAPDRNLSLYAIPRDYHLYIRELAERVLPALRALFPDVVMALFSDHSPLIEGEAAARAGMGVLGKNHLLITPEYGSFVFVAELIVGADYETVTEHARAPFPAQPPVCPGCGACGRACPATDRSGHMVRDCLSALTQKKGDLSAEEKHFLLQSPLIWGCDTCQLVCPLNRAALSGMHDTPIDFFREQRIRHLTSEKLAAMSDDDFRERAFAWRGRDTIRRNLIMRAEKQLPHTEEPVC